MEERVAGEGRGTGRVVGVGVRSGVGVERCWGTYARTNERYGTEITMLQEQ